MVVGISDILLNQGLFGFRKPSLATLTGAFAKNLSLSLAL